MAALAAGAAEAAGAFLAAFGGLAAAADFLPAFVAFVAAGGANGASGVALRFVVLRASRIERRLAGPRTGARNTKIHPTLATGLPPINRPSSNSHG